MERLEKKKKKEKHPKLSGNLDGGKYLPVPLKRTLGGQCGVYSVAHRLSLEWASASWWCWDPNLVFGEFETQRFPL